MRERAKDKGRLQDIIEHANNVTMLIEGYSFEALVADKRTYYSVMKNIEIVGEAVVLWSIIKECYVFLKNKLIFYFSYTLHMG